MASSEAKGTVLHRLALGLLPWGLPKSAEERGSCMRTKQNQPMEKPFRIETKPNKGRKTQLNKTPKKNEIPRENMVSNNIII